MMSIMFFIFLCFLGISAMLYYVLRCQERSCRLLREDNAELRVLLRRILRAICPRRKRRALPIFRGALPPWKATACCTLALTLRPRQPRHGGIPGWILIWSFIWTAIQSRRAVRVSLPEAPRARRETALMTESIL